MAGIDLSKTRLPKRGAIVRVRTAFETFEGEFVGIVPARANAQRGRDRQAKLAIRTEGMSAQLPEGDICEPPKVIRRAPRSKA